MSRNPILNILNRLQLSRKYCTCPCTPSETPKDTQLSILDNGVRVATEASSSSMACISLFIEAGPRFETTCNNGITHFMERMSFKGFKGMTKSKLNEYLRGMGAKMSSKTSREIQTFSAKCIPEAVHDVVGYLGSIITDLELSECEIENEKRNMEQEIIDAENDPKQVLFDYLHQSAFQGTPLAQRVIGPTANISRFDKCLLTSFMSDHYQPYKLALVSVGNVDHDSMVSYAKAKFGHMVGDPCCTSEEGPCRFTGSQVVFRDDSMPYAHVAVALEAPGYGSSDYLALMAAKTMIGSWSKGQGGKDNNALPLARAGSVDDLCEFYEAFYIPYRDVGLWGIYFVSKKMDVDDMLYNVQNAWMEMCVSIQYHDGERAVNALKLEMARKFDGAFRSCYDLGFQTMYSCGRQGINDIYFNLKGINYLNIKAAMEKWIYDRCPAVAAVGPTECLPDYTRIRAGQYWLRL
ncbi:unnamed protein product [Chilo suppressalis]|uniref:Uncharacterized protein n=1 Tax=Chilo suppressalis TaxID=168631 RepID=A0ABN8AZY7_CHISP|nr:unnamed protein product [Chilo suppressalis]